LLQIIHAHSRLCLLFGVLQSRQKQRREDRNDRDDDEQLNEGKAARAVDS